MALFKRKKKEEPIDSRTEIERNFEEKGQAIGKSTGKFVQKSVDKLQGVKQKLEENGTMDKIRDVQVKIDDGIDKAVDAVTKSSQKVVKKVTGGKDKKKQSEEDIYYE